MIPTNIIAAAIIATATIAAAIIITWSLSEIIEQLRKVAKALADRDGTRRDR